MYIFRLSQSLVNNTLTVLFTTIGHKGYCEMRIEMLSYITVDNLMAKLLKHINNTYG